MDGYGSVLSFSLGSVPRVFLLGRAPGKLGIFRLASGSLVVVRSFRCRSRSEVAPVCPSPMLLPRCFFWPNWPIGAPRVCLKPEVLDSEPRPEESELWSEEGERGPAESGRPEAEGV